MSASCIPEKWRIFSGSTLKMLALCSMLIDHTAAFLLVSIESCTAPFFTVLGFSVSVYSVMRLIGRMAFPLYCFLLTEGVVYTRNRKKYGIQLLLFALLSELPWNLVHCNSWHFERQNVFFTLFLGYLCICLYEKYREHPRMQAVVLLGGMAAAVLLKADYGIRGYILILALYALRSTPLLRFVVSSVIPSSHAALSAFLPICLYNGKRGFIHGNIAKYTFYLIYPAQFLILWLLRVRLFGYS